VLLLVATSLSILVLGWRADAPSDVEDALIDLARSLPRALDLLWQVLTGVASLWVVVLLIATVARRRPAVLRDALLSTALAGVLVLLVEQVFLGTADAVSWHGLVAVGPPTGAISLRLALVAAVTVATSPHLTVPFRSLSRWLLAISAVGLVVLGATTPGGGGLGVLCGAAAAAAVHLLLGSSGGQPSLEEVRDALGELGVDAGGLSPARRQTAGLYRVEATDSAGAPLVVKVFGRDAWDAQVLAKTWRALWYRDAAAVTLTRLQQAVHEAFVNLLAVRAGVPVETLVTAGRSTGSTAVVVLRYAGPSLGEVAPGVRRRSLPGMWDAVLALSATGIGHGDLGFDSFVLRGDEVLLTGLGNASVSASGDERRIDLAALVVTGALVDGVEGSVAHAAARLGTADLAAVAPYVQMAALGRGLRGEVRAAGLDLEDVRARLAAAAGVEPPTMARLRRVSPGGLLRVGLLSLAAYAIISLLGGVDYAEVVDALGEAHAGLLLLALVVGQLPMLAQARSTLGACPRPLPYGPVVLLQVAIGFVSLVLPGTAARVAVNIRFFQKQGIPPVSAMSIGVIDSLAGFAVELTILASVLVLGSGRFELDLDRPQRDGNLLLVLGIIAAAVIVAAVVALSIRSVRARVLERVRPWAEEARQTVAGLQSVTKLAQLVGGNVAAQLLRALTLGIVLLAFEASLPLGTLLVVIVGVSLFAGLMPVPGGIGVAEGAFIVGLTAAGIDPATSFATAIAYRLVTFYLPPLWGGVALRKLERDGLL